MGNQVSEMAYKDKKGLSSKKQENLERARESYKAGLFSVNYFPLVIYLEPTSVCNLTCPMCPVGMGVKDYQYEERFLDPELITVLEEPLRNSLRCFMSGGGEPFLHPYFGTLLDIVKSYEPEIIFNTNGTLITREIALHLVKLSIDTVSFSIDAISPEKYRLIRKGAELEQVIEAIIMIQEEKKKLGVEKPYLNMQFTLMRDNLDELKDMVQFAYSLGINHLVIEPLSPIFSFDPVYQEFFRKSYVPADSSLINTLKKLQEQARNRLYFSSHYLQDMRFPQRCVQPWINFGVRTDARVFLCCGTAEKMGSVKEQGFEAVWNGDAYKRFRSEIAFGKYPKSCMLCLQEARAPWFNEELVGQ
jgi:MoaA/NifB/PqqE/SkfB family radical SAM enzyme